MTFNAGVITAAISLNISNFMNSMNQLNRQMRVLDRQMQYAFKSADRAIRGTNSSLISTTSYLKDVDRIVSGILISQAFYGATQEIQRATGAMGQFMGNMEKAQISMEYFVGGAENAQAFIMNMKDFAADTGFNTDQALDLSKRLLNARFDPTQIRAVMETLNDANAVAGATPELMDRIVLAMTQVKTNGRIMGTELRQFAEAGIPIYDILQEKLGLTGEQLMNIGDLQIDGDLGVQAMLEGLKRYEGAADRMAETVPLMWQNIKENMLMIGEQMLQVPYGKFREFLKGIRDTLDEARGIVYEKGIGGLFEHFVPPEMQTSIKIIVGGIQDMAKSFSMLLQAVSPVSRIMATFVLGTLATAMPIIANAVLGFTSITRAAFEAVPALKYFVAALGMILIASSVARSLAFLWTVLRAGSIALIVGRAVLFLASALRILFLVATKNPIARIVLLIAGAMVALAYSSKTVAGWLDRVQAKLAALGGISVDKIFNPKNLDPFDKMIEKYNEDLPIMGDELKKVGEEINGTGKKADKAKKKAEKFVAAFDELYQVPDKLDEVSDGLDNIDPTSGIDPSKWKLDPIDKSIWDNWMALPGIKEYEPPDVPPPGKGPTKPPGNDPTGGPGTPPPMWPAPWDKWTSPDNLLGAAAAAVQRWGEAVKATGIWVAEAYKPVYNWLTVLGESITTGFRVAVDWTVKAGVAIGDFVVGTGAAIGNWAGNAVIQVVKFSAETGATIGKWVADTATAFSKWSTDTWSIVSNWAFETGFTIGTWVIDTTSAIWDWVSDHGIAIGKWYDDNIDRFNRWRDDTEATVEEWVEETAESFRDWAAASITNFQAWSATSLENIRLWALGTATNIANWVTNTSANIYKWGQNTGGNIAQWATATIATIGSWVTTSSSNVASWANNTASNIAKWTRNVVSNIGEFGRAAGSTIANWATGSYKNIRGWISATAGGIYDWARSALSTITSWARSAWQTISNLATAAGERLGGTFKEAGAGLSKAGAVVGDWAASHKTEIAQVAAATIAVTGAAVIAGSGGIAAPVLAPAVVGAVGVMGLERGGIVNKEQLIRIGEKDRTEAVIPMQNPQYMQPFSRAVANDLMSMLGGQGNNSTGQPTMYVHTLIADDRGLRELERKLHVVRLNEEMRRG